MHNFIYRNKIPCNNLFKEPLTFVNLLDTSKHIVLYYANSKFGKIVQFEFIKQGLLKGENGIYCIPDYENKSKIENEMYQYGIDVKYFIKRDLLTIFQIPNLLGHPKGVLKGSEEVFDNMRSNTNSNKSFRLVVRFIDKLNTKEEIDANLVLEKYYHSNFFKFKGSILCHYDVDNCPANSNPDWLHSIFENHHSAIFITDLDGKGVALEL